MKYELSKKRTAALVTAVLWDLIWKAFALWRSARRDQPAWFVAILFTNTVGALPIIYLLTNRETKQGDEITPALTEKA